MHAPRRAAAGPCHPAAFLPLAAALTAFALAGCAEDIPTAAGPAPGAVAQATGSAPGEPVVVSTPAELIAALSPGNAGRRIHLQAGTYAVNQLLVVPDGATLEGAGIMLFDGAGLPTGFSSGTRTTIAITTAVPGNVLTLGDGSAVRGIAIEDLAGRAGNAVGVLSRAPGDRLSATIAEVEIMNPNAHAVAPFGSTGCGVSVVTGNPNLGGDPPPHAGASVAARMTRSLIRSPAMGIGCGVFAFNFAPSGTVSVTLADNVIGGGIIATGGVSRPDAVHDARTEVMSHHNLYRDDSPDACAARHLGWNLSGGAGTPVPLPAAATERNSLTFRSSDDRLERFRTGMLVTAGRRFFAAPIAGPVNDNTIDLQLLGTVVATPACAGAPFVTDFRMAGALVTSASVVPGDGNVVRVVMRGVAGSGTRANAWAGVLGPTGPQPAVLQGSGNLLEIVGNPTAFARTNTAIVPAPGAAFFTGGGM